MTVTDRSTPSVTALPTSRHRRTDEPATAPMPRQSHPGASRPALSPDVSTANLKRGKVRQNIVVLVTASAMGLWLAIAAPSVSPAAPPAPATTSIAAASTIETPVLPDVSVPNRPRGGRR